MIDEIIDVMRVMREMNVHAAYCEQRNKGVRPTKRAIQKVLYNQSIKAKTISYKLIRNRIQRHR